MELRDPDHVPIETIFKALYPDCFWEHATERIKMKNNSAFYQITLIGTCLCKLSIGCLTHFHSSAGNLFPNFVSFSFLESFEWYLW